MKLLLLPLTLILAFISHVAADTYCPAPYNKVMCAGCQLCPDQSVCPECDCPESNKATPSPPAPQAQPATPAPFVPVPGVTYCPAPNFAIQCSGCQLCPDQSVCPDCKSPPVVQTTPVNPAIPRPAAPGVTFCPAPNAAIQCSDCQLCPDRSVCPACRVQPPLPTCPAREFNFSDMTGDCGGPYNFIDIYKSGLTLPVAGYASKTGAKLNVFVGPFGLGVAPQIGAVSPETYIQFDLNQYLGLVANFNIVGDGQVAIYGSNLFGGVLAGAGQYLLYQGPATAYRYTRLGEFRYISITTSFGFNQVKSVSFEVQNHVFQMTDLLGGTDPQYTFSSHDDLELELTISGYTTEGLLSNLYGTGFGIGVYDGGYETGFQIDTTHYIQVDVSAYSAVNTLFDIIGAGLVTIYGSNLKGGVIGQFGQNILYSGPAQQWTYTGYGQYKYINIGTKGGYCQLRSVIVGCPTTAQQVNPNYNTYHTWLFNDVTGAVGNEYYFSASDYSNMRLHAYGWDNIGVGTSLYSGPNGLGITANANYGYQVDNKNFIQLDVNAFLGLPINLNIAGSAGAIVSIYASNIIGGVIGQFENAVIYTGPITNYQYTGNFRYVSIMAKNGYVSLKSCSVNSQYFYPSYPQYWGGTPSQLTSPMVAPSQPYPVCTKHTWDFTTFVSVSPLPNYKYAALDAAGYLLPTYGWTSKGAGVQLFTNGIGLGVLDTAFIGIDNTHYIQFDLSSYLGQVVTFNIAGAGIVSIYGSPLLGGVIGQFQQYLLYRGPARSYTYTRQGEFKYVSISADFSTVVVKSVEVQVSNHEFHLNDLIGEASAPYSFYASDNSGLTLPVSAYTNNALVTNLFGTAVGLGVSITGAILGYQVSINNYIQFDLNLYLSAAVTFNIVGNGQVMIYGSNLKGGVLGGHGQTLLYQGPAVSFKLPAASGYRYVSVTTGSGYTKVASVRVGC